MTLRPFNNDLEDELAALRQAGLHRELRRIDSPQGPRLQLGGCDFLNFSSNDYLGLAAHPALKEAAVRAVEKFGAGAGASRLICGSLAPHHELEERLADFKGTAAALSFSSGYATALGTLTALVGKDDTVILDRLAHACIVDAARLSGARLRVYAHNDPEDLERKLRWAAGRHARAARPAGRRPRILIASESVFSMDGDLAPLREIVELKDRYGAWLMLDEAHATGLFGANRRGLAEAFGLADRIEIQMGTLGKALGASGGYIAGSRPLIDLLVHRARSFLFSTAPVPAAAAAAAAAIEVVRTEEGERRRATVWSLVDQLKNGLLGRGGPWTLPLVQSPILPLLIGDEQRALRTAAALRDRGIFIPAIRYPTVGRGQARLRLTVTAAHSTSDLMEFLATLPHLPRET
ncbi:MAG TPA: 8-amino-7-oxononanoate synthase [Methylomirabilota bacterium]|nr:8-amino-7-oxononanoate synthase [Methylomirabilota bacterium]